MVGTFPEVAFELCPICTQQPKAVEMEGEEQKVMHGPGHPGTHTSVTLDTQAGPGCRGRDRTEEVTVPPGGRGLQLGLQPGEVWTGRG